MAEKKHKSKQHDLRDHNTVGHRLRQRRLELEMTAFEVDDRSGKPRGSVSTIEWRNCKMVQLHTAKRLAAALKLNFIWLLTGEGDRLIDE